MLTPFSAPTVSPVRVLVADGDDRSRDLCVQAFAASGCETEQASDGRDALAKALVREPGLIVAAVRLPFIDGIALCRILRRDQITAGIPIVVVGEAGLDEERERARQAGADLVLSRPVAVDLLIAESRRLISRG